jgi:hypothetical protein
VIRANVGGPETMVQQLRRLVEVVSGERGRGAGAVPLRDSKNARGPVLFVPVAAWAPFIEAVKRHRGGNGLS